MAFKPNDTQELIKRNYALRSRRNGSAGDTDGRFREKYIMESLSAHDEMISNNDDATREMDIRLVKIETTLLVIKWVIFTALPAIVGFLATLHLRISL